jgi:elongation factor Ts
MTTITASLVKELRDKTGAGMMDCKTALTESEGNLEAAIDWLRKKGLSKAANKAGRVAAEGLIGAITLGREGAMVEVNSETDFVARNEKFQDMVGKITALAPKAKGDLAQLVAMTYPGTSVPVESFVKDMVATIGENLTVRRTAHVSVESGTVADYLHNKAAPGLGKIAVLIGLESRAEAAQVAKIGRALAMHVAAANPQAVTVDDLNPALIERERSVFTAQAQASGKSADIIAKMVEGRLRKEFYQQVVLMQQIFLGAGGDGKQTVEQFLKAAEAAVGMPIKVVKFVRFALGEGIDRKDGDFAGDVAAALRRQ